MVPWNLSFRLSVEQHPQVLHIMLCHVLCILCAAFGVINDDNNVSSYGRTVAKKNDKRLKCVSVNITGHILTLGQGTRLLPM